MINIKEVSKNLVIRLILSSVVFIYISVKSLQLLTDIDRFNKVSYVELFAIIFLLIGIILFSLNRKITDYISFSIFIFFFGGVLPVEIIKELNIYGYTFNFQKVFFSKVTLVFLLLISPLIYLIISFVRKLGKK